MLLANSDFIKYTRAYLFRLNPINQFLIKKYPREEDNSFLARYWEAYIFASYIFKDNNYSDKIAPMVVTPEKFLYSLGIRFVGERMSKLLLKEYKDIMRLLDVTYEELVNLEGVGPIKAKTIYEYLSNPKNRDLVLNYLVEFKFKKEEKLSNKLDQKTFLITGTLTRPRKEIEKLITDNDGTMLSSVSSKLNYLIVGENAGSKLEKAKKLGIEIIEEKDLNDFLK